MTFLKKFSDDFRFLVWRVISSTLFKIQNSQPNQTTLKLKNKSIQKSTKKPHLTFDLVNEKKENHKINIENKKNG
jgi:hypothetical protein